MDRKKPTTISKAQASVLRHRIWTLAKRVGESPQTQLAQSLKAAEERLLKLRPEIAASVFKHAAELGEAKFSISCEPFNDQHVAGSFSVVVEAKFAVTPDHGDPNVRRMHKQLAFWRGEYDMLHAKQRTRGRTVLVYFPSLPDRHHDELAISVPEHFAPMFRNLSEKLDAMVLAGSGLDAILPILAEIEKAAT